MLCSLKRKTRSIKASAGFQERKYLRFLKTVNFVNCGEIFKSCALLLYICTKSNRLIWVSGAVAKLFGQFVYNILQTSTSFKTDFLFGEKIRRKIFLRAKFPLARNEWRVGLVDPLEQNIRGFLFSMYRYNINVDIWSQFDYLLKYFWKFPREEKTFIGCNL